MQVQLQSRTTLLQMFNYVNIDRDDPSFQGLLSHLVELCATTDGKFRQITIYD